MTCAKRIVLAALAGGLLILSFPWARQGWLVYLALLPLLVIIYNTRPWQAWLYGWLTGAVFFGGLCYWVSFYGLLPWLIMAVGIGIFFGAAAAGASWLAARLGSAARLLALPALWAGLEILRSETGVYSFPFGVLGYSQAGWQPALGLASFIGVYGISFVIVIVNVALFEAARVWRKEKSPRFSAAAAALSVAILALALGAWSAATVPAGAGPVIKVALVQASVPQDEKWLATKRDQIMTEYKSLVRRAARGHPDVIVLPEAALPAYVEKDSPLYEELVGWAKDVETPILAGVPLLKGNEAMNTAVLFDGRGRFLADYAKMIPTLFGEQVPWRPVTEFIYPMFRSIGDITAGRTQTIFRLPIHREALTFGVLICSESFYQSLARQAVGRGGETLFVITNDAWFRSSSEARLHFDMTAFRAAENGREVTQTGNTGISGHFDASGHPVETLGLGNTGVVFAKVQARTGRTLYGRGGWFFPYALLMVTALLLGLYLAGERLHKATKG